MDINDFQILLIDVTLIGIVPIEIAWKLQRGVLM